MKFTTIMYFSIDEVFELGKIKDILKHQNKNVWFGKTIISMVIGVAGVKPKGRAKQKSR